MEEQKKLSPTKIFFLAQDKTKLEKEKIIFMDISLPFNHLLLLSSSNILYLCEFNNNIIKIKKKLEYILQNPETKITHCYFCNESKDTLLLLCDDKCIYEYSVNREYISHIYYLALGESYIFKMNWKKNSNPENGIKNFCVYKNRGLRVWNILNCNKSNTLYIQDLNCFSYDCTGIALYLLGKSDSKNLYYLSVIKFYNEYSCKEIYFKFLNFLESKIDINYMDIFDNNIIMCDRTYKTIYILKTYPLNKFDFIISLNNINGEKPLLFFPFLGENHLYQYGLLYVNLKEKKQNLLNICYKSNRCSTDNVDLSFHKVYYYKENNNGKSVLFIFNDDEKQLIKYLL